MRSDGRRRGGGGAARAERDDARHRLERAALVANPARSDDALRTRCIDGITADTQRARELLDRSTAVATALSPHIGYAATAEIAKESVRTGKSIAQIARERGVLTDAQLDALLSPERMTTPDK